MPRNRLPSRRRLARLAIAVAGLLLPLAATAPARPARAAEDPGKGAAATTTPPTPKLSLKVDVDGIGGELKKNVLATLRIEAAVKDKDLDEARIQDLHRQAPGEIEQALQPYGYYRVVVAPSLDHQGNDWVARYKVDAGPQIKVASVDVQVVGPGAGDSEFQRLVHAFPLHQGQGLFELAYESGKKSFDDYAAGHGYLDAKFEVNQIRIDLAAYSAAIVLHYDTGPRYHYGPVRFHQDFLRPALLEGYVRWKQGDPISAQQILELQRALSDTTYFQRVEVVARRDQRQGLEVPIDVNLVPARPQRWTAGVGYGTDTGPRANLGLELRHINELGQRFTAQATVSQVDKEIRADYLIPGFFPRTDVLDFTLAYADLSPPTSHSLDLLAGPTYTYSIGRWRNALSLDYQRESFTVGLDNGISDLVIPQDVLSRVYSDDRIYPTHGEKYDLMLRGGAKALASDTNFIQTSADAKFVQSLGKEKRFRLISRVFVGYTATDHFAALPPTERFFAGGDQSVRGYAYQGIGARDAAGNVIGGTDTEVASVELQYRFSKIKLLEKFGVAVFYDAGGAGFTFGSEIKQGTGAGIFWLSPIGPVRVYIATALSIPGNPLRFHFTIGPDL